MTPTDLRNLLLFEEPTDENYKLVPDDARGLWIGRPAANRAQGAKSSQKMRWLALAVTAIYFVFERRHDFGFFVMLVVLALYEHCYAEIAIAQQENLDSEDIVRYRNRVDQYLINKFPGMKFPT